MKKLYLALLGVIIIGVVLFTGCGGGDDRIATDGDTVSVHYTGTLDDGSKFDSSLDRGEPLTFTIGGGQMIAGFDNAVRGMKVGETKTATFPPEEAYGQHLPDLVVTLSREQFPEDQTFSVGQQVPMTNNSGQQFIVIIVDMGPGTITVDANHELAGKDLTFEIELMTITRAGE